MEVQYFDNYIQASDALEKILDKAQESLDFEHVVIVPDVYSFYYEKLLYLKNKGSFSIVVRSFSRLFSQYCSSSTVLPSTGAVLLIKKIARSLSNELVCFKYSHRKSGFATQMYETISRLKEQRIEPNDMMAEGARKAKIEDVKKIYAKYNELTRGKFVDSAGKNAKLTEYFASLTCKQNKKYYVLNFDVLNADAQALLKEIDSHSAGVTILKARESEKKIKLNRAVIYKAESNVDQLKEVARRIVNDTKTIALDDICVTGEGLDANTIMRIFNDYSLPFYVDKRTNLSTHSLARFVISAINCANKGIKRDAVITLVKNPCFLASKQEKDDFCAYVSRFLVTYKGFYNAFDKDFEGVANAEKVRKRLATILKIATLENKNVSGEQWKEFVSEVVKCASYNESANDFITKQKAYDSIMLALNQIELAFGQEKSDYEFLLESLFDVFTATEYSLIPQMRGCVKVGSLNNFRGQKFKKIYIVGFNDGIVPKIENDCALLLDGDIREMEKNGLEFEPKISNLNRRYRDELWQLLKNDGEFVFTYVSDDNNKKSFDLQLLQEQNDIKEYTGKDYVNSLIYQTDAQRFADLLACKQNAIEKMYLMDEGENASALYEIFKDETKNYKKRNKEVIESKYTSLKYTSVSALQTYAGCPFRYFASNLLRLKKIEDGTVRANDVGNIMHEVVERYLDKSEKDPDEKIICEIFDEVTTKDMKANLPENARVIEYLKKEALRLCRIARMQIENGGYKMLGSEISFGKKDVKHSESDIEGVVNYLDNTAVLLGKNGEISLIGAIDRVDVCDSLARVVDYKTGSTKNVDFSKLYYGEGLQLPIYCQVMKKNGYDVGGMFYFPFVASWGEEENNKLNGLHLNSEKNELAMTLTSLDGEKIAPNKKNGLTKDELECTVNYAMNTAQRIVDRIECGNFEPSPLSSGRNSACSYCDFKGICGFDDINGKRRNRSVSDASAKKYVIGTEVDNG